MSRLREPTRLGGARWRRRIGGKGRRIGYGADREAPFWISQWPGDGPPREVHVAFAATSRAQVEDFHATAVASGATSLHAPREWPEYHPGYYGAFVRDPDGNNVEAVCHTGSA